MRATTLLSLLLGLGLGWLGALVAMPSPEPSEAVALDAPAPADCSAVEARASRLQQQVARLEGQVQGLREAEREAPSAVVAAPAPAPQIVVIQPEAAPAPARTRTTSAAPSGRPALRAYSGPYVAPQGDVAEVSGAVSNFGSARGRGTLYVELVKNGAVVDEETVALDLDPGEDYRYAVILRLAGEGAHSARAYIR